MFSTLRNAQNTFECAHLMSDIYLLIIACVDVVDEKALDEERHSSSAGSWLLNIMVPS